MKKHIDFFVNDFTLGRNLRVQIPSSKQRLKC